MKNWFLPLVMLVAMATQVCGEYVWVEGEDVVKSTMPISSWMKGDNPKLLSNGDAFGGLCDRSELPSPCYLLYKLTVPTDSLYYLYLRQNFQSHTGKARYRFVKLNAEGKPIDKSAAEWIDLDPDAPMFDRISIGQHRSVEWIQYDPIDLEAGDYYLDFQITDANINKREANPPVWFMVDAICLTTEPFTPRGTLKPGEKAVAPQGGGEEDYY